MSIEEVLERKINQAVLGRKRWLKLAKTCDISEDTYVILFPQRQTECNKYVLKHLPDFVRKMNAKHLLILSHDEEILNSSEKYGEAKCERIMWSREEAEDLMAYYTMQMFTQRLIIASLDEPEGRNGRNIIGVNGITEEEAAVIGILGLRHI